MNILKDVVRGASTQFGREFGRAGANAVLKGKNHYTIKNTTDFEGRIKPSDSDLVKAIKEIRKVKFVTTDKANISRLIDLTDIANSQIKFKGQKSLDEISSVTALVDEYDDKYEHGEVLVDSFTDKSLDYLTAKRQEFVDNLTQYNIDTKEFVKRNLAMAIKNKKNKSLATWLSCPFLIIGALGFHQFYLKNYLYGVVYILLLVTGISGLLSLVNFINFLTMSEAKFDNKYNNEYGFM